MIVCTLVLGIKLVGDLQRTPIPGSTESPGVRRQSRHLPGRLHTNRPQLGLWPNGAVGIGIGCGQGLPTVVDQTQLPGHHGRRNGVSAGVVNGIRQRIEVGHAGGVDRHLHPFDFQFEGEIAYANKGVVQPGHRHIGGGRSAQAIFLGQNTGDISSRRSGRNLHRALGSVVIGQGYRFGWKRCAASAQLGFAHLRQHGDPLFQHFLPGVQVEIGFQAGGATGRQIRRVDPEIIANTREVAIVISLKALDAHALVVDNKAVLVHTKLTRSGVPDLTAVVEHKEAIAIDGQIQAIIGEADITLTEILLDVLNPDPITDGIRSGAQKTAGIEIPELGLAAFEADSAGIGNVVTGDVQINGRCPQAAESCIESHVTPRNF